MTDKENLERALALCNTRIRMLHGIIENQSRMLEKGNIEESKTQLRMEENNYRNLEKRIAECKNPSFVSQRLSRGVRR